MQPYQTGTQIESTLSQDQQLTLSRPKSSSGAVTAECSTSLQRDSPCHSVVRIIGGRLQGSPLFCQLYMELYVVSSQALCWVEWERSMMFTELCLPITTGETMVNSRTIWWEPSHKAFFLRREYAFFRGGSVLCKIENFATEINCRFKSLLLTSLLKNTQR